VPAPTKGRVTPGRLALPFPDPHWGDERLQREFDSAASEPCARHMRERGDLRGRVAGDGAVKGD